MNLNHLNLLATLTKTLDFKFEEGVNKLETIDISSEEFNITLTNLMNALQLADKTRSLIQQVNEAEKNSKDKGEA